MKVFTPGQIALMTLMSDQGKNWTEIGKEFDTTGSTVKRRVTAFRNTMREYFCWADMWKGTYTKTEDKEVWSGAWYSDK